MNRVGLLLVSLLLLSCAKQGIPPGGPEDRRGPTILYCEPSEDSVGVSPDVRPLFQFDEWVDRESVALSTFISPVPEGEVKYKWRRKSVRLEFPELLRQDYTYVITLGTGIKDLRGNPMPWSYTLAFSTGDHLDKAAVEGRIYGEDDLTGIQVWAYELGDFLDPDPRERGPDYITQADQTGYYLFTHLREGEYRIFAIDDRRRNRRWDADEDRIGVAFKDIIAVQDSVTSGVNMLMTLQDTTGAHLLSVRVLDRNHLTIRFSEPVYPVEDQWRVHIQDSSDVQLEVQSAFQDAQDSLSWRVGTEIQEAQHRYFLWVEGFVDRNGNVNFPDSVVFEGSSLADTLGPVLLETSPENRQRDVEHLPHIRMVFDEEVVLDSGAVRLVGPYEIPLTVDINIAGSIVTMVPHDSLVDMYSLDVNLDLGAVRDPVGNTGPDSVASWYFTVVRRDTLGEVHGVVEDPDTGATGPVIMEAERLGAIGSDWRGTWKIEVPGAFILPWLMPGEYRLWAYRDEDWSGDYSFGTPFPFAYAERFAFYGDTVTVRSRWETAGIEFWLPSRLSNSASTEPTEIFKVTP